MKSDLTDSATTAHPVGAVTERPMKRTRTRELLRHSVFEIFGALVVGGGAVLIANAAFGVDTVLTLVLIAYLAFMATIALVEFVGGPSEDVIDLTVEEPAPVEPEEPRLQVVSDTDPSEDRPIKRKRIKGEDVAELVVAAIGAAAFAELLRIVIHMRSLVGVAIWWYVAFIAIYFVLVRDRNHSEAALDRVVSVLVWSVGLVIAATLVWMVTFVVIKGAKALNGDFFTQDLAKVGPLDSGGGAKHAILGTLEQVGLATIVVVPVGILTAVYLHEINGRLAKPVRFIVDAMAGLPSIVAGLLVFTVWVKQNGYSGIAGAFALAILMLPTMTRASEEILRTVPDPLREGALALGAPQWRLVQKVVLPTAIAGIVTASLLAIARAIGETAPLLLTSFGSPNTNVNPSHDPQASLPLFVWSLIRLPNQRQNDRAWAGALLLIIIVFVLFVSARYVSTRGRRKLEGRR